MVAQALKVGEPTEFGWGKLAPLREFRHRMDGRDGPGLCSGTRPHGLGAGDPVLDFYFAVVLLTRFDKARIVAEEVDDLAATRPNACVEVFKKALSERRDPAPVAAQDKR